MSASEGGSTIGSLRVPCEAVLGGNWNSIRGLRHELLSIDLSRLTEAVADETMTALFLAKEIYDRIWTNFGTDASFSFEEESAGSLREAAEEAARILEQGLRGVVGSEQVARAIGAYFKAVREREAVIQLARGQGGPGRQYGDSG